MRPAVRYVSLLERSGYGIAALRNLRALRPSLETLDWRPLVAFPGRPYGELDASKSRRLARLLFGASGDVAELIDCRPSVAVTVPVPRSAGCPATSVASNPAAALPTVGPPWMFHSTAPLSRSSATMPVGLGERPESRALA